MQVNEAENSIYNFNNHFVCRCFFPQQEKLRSREEARQREEERKRAKDEEKMKKAAEKEKVFILYKCYNYL